MPENKTARVLVKVYVHPDVREALEQYQQAGRLRSVSAAGEAAITAFLTAEGHLTRDGRQGRDT